MDEITVKDVLECVGENINPARDISGNPSSGVESKTSPEGQAIKVDTTEFNLTKNFFQNLGVLMQEYLTTTTLGDLQRKSRDANTSTDAPMQAATITPSINDTTDMNTSSVIRPNIGEINQ
jgi:Rrf2 family iron-sulfur cluster assembly transcriptional regulator